MLDPDIAAFAADQDATFDQAFSARPIKEQRALYEEFWRRYHAPRPAGVEATDFNVLGLSGHIPVRSGAQPQDRECDSNRGCGRFRSGTACSRARSRPTLQQ